MNKPKYATEFVQRVKDDDRDFAGSLYVKEDKVYNIEMPNGDAITICCTKDKDGPVLQVVSSAFCIKTDVEVQAFYESKRFKPGPEPKVYHMTAPQAREFFKRLQER